MAWLHARLRGGLRADAASAFDSRQRARAPVRALGRRGVGLDRAPVVRRARLADVPAGVGSLLDLGGRGGGVRGAHASGAGARRAARLSGRAVRGADRRRRAARGEAAAEGRARAGTARARGAVATRGVGAGRVVRAVDVAVVIFARAAGADRAGGRGAGRLGARRPDRDGRPAPLVARDGCAGGRGEQATDRRRGAALDAHLLRVHVAGTDHARDPGGARVRVAALPQAGAVAAGGGRGDDARLRNRTDLRAAADRALHPNTRGPVDTVLRTRAFRLALAAARARADGLGGRGAGGVRAVRVLRAEEREDARRAAAAL